MTFIPFGAGIAYCPGRRFIRAEVKLFFMHLILNLDFALLNREEVVLPDPQRAGIGVFPPLKDIDCFIKKRSG